MELEEVRNNGFIRIHRRKGCVACDDFCEILNYLVKRLPPSGNISTLAAKTGGLMLFRQCRLSEEGIYDEDDDSYIAPRSTVLPSSKYARAQVFSLLLVAEVLTPMGHDDLDDGFLWDKISPAMVAGRAKSEVGDKGDMTKAERVLQGLWDRSKKQKDESESPATTLPDDDAENESDDEGEAEDAGKDGEKDTEDEDKLAKILTKAKKAKIFRGGKAVMKGLATVGAKQIWDEQLLRGRKDELLSAEERTMMTADARKRSAEEDDTVIDILDNKLKSQREGKKPRIPIWKREADGIRRSKKLI